MLVNILKTEIINNKPVHYIDVPAKYISHFNKLHLISDKRRLYCELINISDEDYPNCEIELLKQYLNQEVDNSLFSKMFSND